MNFARIVEGTITLIIIYLVVSNSYGVARLAEVGGNTYVSAVKALQGR